MHKKNYMDMATAPIPGLVIKNCVPALIAMVMVMVYNLADTFFIGLTHDDMQVAAVSLASPVFMIFLSLGTLFGTGGTSVISRALGAGKVDFAKKVSSFCMWACVIVGAVIMAALWLFLDKIVVLLGASAETKDFTRTYLAIPVSCGIFSMISNCFSSVIRTEGQAMKAMTGSVIGNLLNVALDPIMILGFKWGIKGAAIATVIGNAVSALYYLAYFFTGKSQLSIGIRHFSAREGILKGVVGVGLSASLSNLLVSLSSIVVNGRLAAYSDLYVAGYGVTSKVIMIVTLFGIGIGSGVQPLVGYSFGARNKERMQKTIRFAAGFGITLCVIAAVLCFIFAEPIVRVFLTGREAIEIGVKFTRILMSTAWGIGGFCVCQTSLQALGAATPALFASVFRQGIIFIPLMFILEAAMGVLGLVWAQPAADMLSLVTVVLMLRHRVKKEFGA